MGRYPKLLSMPGLYSPRALTGIEDPTDTVLPKTIAQKVIDGSPFD